MPQAADELGVAVQGGGRHSALDVLWVTLRLGVTSFGGPIAHLGYFERAYVRDLHWLSAEDYAGIVALCQMLPGPASSQVGFLVGLRRAGWLGALAAWMGFTLPSAVLMFAFALLAPDIHGRIAEAAVHGLKLVAVAVVAQAVWSMARKLCPDRATTGLALAAALLLLVIGGPAAQTAALAVGAVGGALLCRGLPALAALPAMPASRRGGIAALAVFLALLAVAVLAGPSLPHSLAAMGMLFYRAGALVFGGGHVVLPLLRDALVPSGWMSDSQFLTGYGAAQAMPGPLFTFAAYLGATMAPAGQALLWSLVALVFMFLPGMLVAVAGLPVWTWLGRHRAASAALAGINAAVVGVLGAALYDPVWVGAVHSGRDAVIAATGWLLLERWRAPPLAIVVFCIAAALAFATVAG